MSRILALDASEQACSVAIIETDEQKSSNIVNCIQPFKVAPREHAKLMLPMVEEALAEAGWALTQMDAIAFARGPGAFTGLRIAVSAVQGLALGADLGVIPISTLMAMAEGAWREQQKEQTVVALDARMGEVYIGGFKRVGLFDYRTLLTEQVAVPTSVQLSDTSFAAHAIGSGWGVHSDVLQQQLGAAGIPLSTIEPVWHCQARDVAALAIPVLQRGGSLPPERAEPIYLRDNVAKKSAKKSTDKKSVSNHIDPEKSSS